MASINFFLLGIVFLNKRKIEDRLLPFFLVLCSYELHRSKFENGIKLLNRINQFSESETSKGLLTCSHKSPIHLEVIRSMLEVEP